MKKKILIALFVVIMVCLFSFVVSAADEVTLVGGEKADLTTVFKVDSKNQITGFNSGYSKNDVTDVIFPDEIVGLESNFLFGSATNLNTITFAATDTFFISGDGIFSSCSVKKITFNPDCVVEIRKGNFSDCTSLTEITFPKFKKLAGSAFKGCSKMVATNELILAEGMTDIGGHAFNGCTSLKGTVYFPESLQTIQEYSFQSTGFEYFDLSKCVNLTAVGGGYGGPFTNSDYITKIDLSACVNLKNIKSSFIADSDNLVEVILPPNLENIPHKAFAHCYKLQSIVLPASMLTVSDEAFHSARRGQDVMTFTVYVQSNVKFHDPYAFRDSGAKIEFVLLGDVTLESFLSVNTYDRITKATIVDYADPTSPWTYEVGKSITNHTIVTNYCDALALTGDHKSDSNPCVINCSACGLSTVKENPQHTEATSIVYANGYGSVGAVITACTNVGCPHKITNEAEALFTCVGYSAPLNGQGGISIGFKVNNEAIEAYTDITGSTVKYGVFAVSQNKLGQDTIFDENGNANEFAITAEIKATEFSAFELKINGFTTDEQMEAMLALGAYVKVTGNGVSEYSYIQDKAPSNGDSYHFVSFNSIIESLK